MADVQTTDINTKPTVTAIDSNDQIYISDGGTALKKISYTNLAKAIIEQYNASQLAGATKTIQAAFNELNSKSNTYIGTATGSNRQEFVQNLVTLINNTFPLANLANGTVLTGSATWSGQGYCGYVVTRNSGGANITVQIGGEIVSALIDTRNLAISAFTDLNSNLVFDSNALSQSGKSTVEYLDSLKAGCIVQAHTWVKLSDMPSELTDGLMSVVFIADKGNRNYDYVIVNKNGDQWLAYPNGNTTGNRTLNWVKQPTRAEVNALNSKLFKQLGANLSDDAFDALTADGLYVGYIPTTSCPCKQQWSYIHVKSLSANANDVIQEVVGITSAITCTRMKSSGTWGNWVLAPTRAEVDALNSKMTSLSNDNRRMPKVIEYNNNASEPKTLNITVPQQTWSFMSILVLRPTAPVIISAHQNASAIYDINMKNIFTGELDSGITYDGLVISIPTLGYETGYVFGTVGSISLT